MLMKLNPNIVFKLLNIWPPFLGAGIRVKTSKTPIRYFETRMKLSFYNQNYVGTHFGGSLFSMTDPFMVLILIEELGKQYLVWDKSASIKFVKPGKGCVRARFEVSEKELKHIKSQCESNEKFEPEYKVNILDESDQVVAVVTKKLWIKRKDKHIKG